MWVIMDAINNCLRFEISYPTSLEEHRNIAVGFEAASIPDINNCVGAIDGILIWMLKPSHKETRMVGVDHKKKCWAFLHDP